MSRSNRERRAAKQKQRRGVANERQHKRSAAGPSRAEILEVLVFALSGAANVPAPFRATELLEQYRGLERELDVAADLVVQEAIRMAWKHGWSPKDLHEVARRRVDAAGVQYLDEAIVLESQRYSASTLHPRWRAELAEISAGLDPSPTAPQMWRWAAAHSIDRRAAVTVVLEVLHLLARIPRLEPLLPLPGENFRAPGGTDEADEKMLARVRALLAKAEATEYPDEAEALSAKAQALMARHSLREAVANYDKGRAPVTAARRIWIDNPYVAPKVALVQAVAQANRCRTVWIKDLGCVVTVGVGTDVETVELLSASLLLQAKRAMLVAGRRLNTPGQRRTKSFRFSFLVAYATRIGERLGATSSSATTEVQHDDRLLPVLAACDSATEQAFSRLFPATVASPLVAYDFDGIGAGRAAADTAILEIRHRIAG